MGEPTLFPTPPRASVGRPPPARDRRVIARGKHPASGRCLLRVTDRASAGVCCGDCVHATRRPTTRDRAGPAAWTCDVQGVGDVRISWPACVLFDPRPSPVRWVRRGRYPVASS